MAGSKQRKSGLVSLLLAAILVGSLFSLSFSTSGWRFFEQGNHDSQAAYATLFPPDLDIDPPPDPPDTSVKPDSYEGKEIQKVIDELRRLGEDAEADNIQDYLDKGKIKIEDLDDHQGENNSKDGPVTIDDSLLFPERFNNGNGMDLSNPVDYGFFPQLADTLIHEKYHSHNHDFLDRAAGNVPEWFGGTNWMEMTAWLHTLNALDRIIATLAEECAEIAETGTDSELLNCLRKLSQAVNHKITLISDFNGTYAKDEPEFQFSDDDLIELRKLIDAWIEELENELTKDEEETSSTDNISGEYKVGFNVTEDPAGHAPFIGEMPGELIIEQGSIFISGAHPFVGVQGEITTDGSFTATGMGTVAGFDDVSVEFVGTLDAAGLSGQYTMGVNGELFGVPITYGVAGQKLDSDSGANTGILDVLADLQAFEAQAIPQHETQIAAAGEQVGILSTQSADKIVGAIATVTAYEKDQPVQIRLVVQVDQGFETLLSDSDVEAYIDYRGLGKLATVDINNPFDSSTKAYSDLSDVDYTMYTLLSSLPAMLSASPENIQKLYDAGVFIVVDGSGEIAVTNLSKGVRDASSARVASSGNNVYVVWQETMAETNTDVFFSRSTDGGKTFAAPVNISSNDGRSTLPQIAVFEDNVYVLWNDNSSGSSDIFFARSTDSGVTFADAANISNSNVLSLNPKIAVAGDGTAIAVWAEMVSLGNLEILAARSIDNGETFANAVNISNSPQGSFAPQLAASGQTVYVAWVDSTPGYDDIFLSSSADSAATFSAAINISNTQAKSSLPQLAITSEHAHLVWQDAATGNGDIYYARGTVEKRFDVTNISDNEPASQSPYLTLGNDLHVLWHDSAGGEVMLEYSGSPDRGISFQPAFALSSAPEISASALVASGSGVSVVWTDSLRLSLLKSSADRSDEVLILGRGAPELPSISLAESNLYVAWQDSSSGKGTIYFAKSTSMAGTLKPVPEELQKQIDEEMEQEIVDESINVESTIIEIPRAVDSEGQVISRSSRGAPVEIEVEATKVEYPEDRPVLFTFEVRDENGITVHFQTKESSFAIGDNILMKFSWVPDEPGTFTLRSFLMTSLEDPTILSDVVTSTIVVE